MDIVDSVVLDQAFVGLHQKVQRPDSTEHARAMSVLGNAAKRLLPKDRPLSPKWHMIMTMQLRGMTTAEISKRIRCSVQTVSNISRTERYQRALQIRMADLDSDLLALKPKAIEALGDALGDSSIDVRLRAAKEFFVTTGTMNHGKREAVGGGGTSPEDLAKALLAAARAQQPVEVHIHSTAEGRVEADAGRRFAGPVIDQPSQSEADEPAQLELLLP